MPEPRAKKINLACDNCRKRKRKCDGKTPICSLCEKSGYECIYDATLDQRRPAQKNYVTALEARVALLESVLKNAGAADVVDALDLATAEGGEPISQGKPAMTPALASSSTALTLTQNEHETGFVPADDAANVVEFISLANPEQPASDTQSLDQFDLGMANYVPLVSLAAEHELLTQFWDWQRMHLPYIAPVPFLQAYALCSEAAHPDEPIPPPPPPPPSGPPSSIALSIPRAASVKPAADLVQFISPLLLDAVFAISALFHGNLETSERFYRRAEARVMSEVANPRLATVQAMLIMATWELGHARAPATWTLLGVTCALCIRLGMHVDATPLLRRGVLTQRVFEARNFVFWATYNKDRFCSICMGMHPLIDRRMITTPRHSSLSADNVGTAKQGPDAPADSDAGIAWWDPRVLGLGDMLNQAGWEATRDLIRLTDTLFEGIYSFDAPKRTPQQDLELVTRNNLTIQRFLDEMPAWLRSTGVMRKKENGLVYLHLFTHLASIVASRPFLSPRPLPEDAMRIDATIDPSQPNHSSHIIRRYRTLAFRVARASALQTIGLVRHIPLSSPCVTLPYVVYSACTILLLAPDDPAAMDSVRTGIACLESLDESGYWVISARDAKERVQALARRWGVNVGPGKKVLGHLGGGAGGSGGGPSDNSRSATEGPHTSGNGSQEMSSSTSTHLGSSTPNTTPSATNVSQPAKPPQDCESVLEAPPGASRAHLGSNSSQPNDYIGASNQAYPGGYPSKSETTQENALPPSYDDIVGPQTYGYSNAPKSYESHSSEKQSGPSVIASGMVQPAQVEVYAQPHPYTMDSMPAYPQQMSYSGQQQPQYQFQQPIQVHYHVHSHSHSHQHVHQYQQPPQNMHYLSQPQRHVGYASSHGDAQHDFGVPHNHWHQIMPPSGPVSDFPPDPVACSDVAECFRGTVQTTQDPTFVQNMSDPYSGLATEWFSDAQDSFALITPEMYGKGIPFALSGTLPVPDALNAESSGAYAQGSTWGTNTS